MKKKVFILAVLLLIVIVAGNSMFTVQENEYACTVRFSAIIKTTDTAGLHFKVPFLDSVKTFTKATQLYDIPPSEVLTSDKQNMTVDCYILWSISDPLRFFQSLGTNAEAEQRLDALTYNELKTVMGTLAQADKLIQNAEYLKQKRINEAIEQVAMFEAMYAEYAQNPDITRSRMYYEAISQILPGVKLYINTGDGSDVNMLLPLDTMVGGN